MKVLKQHEFLALLQILLLVLLLHSMVVVISLERSPVKYIMAPHFAQQAS